MYRNDGRTVFCTECQVPFVDTPGAREQHEQANYRRHDGVRIPVRIICPKGCSDQILPMNQDEIHRAILYASCPTCKGPWSVTRLV